MNKLNDPKIKLDKALAHFGSKSLLAGALGLNRTTVTDWVNKEKLTYVPAIHAYRLLRCYSQAFKDDG